MRKYFCFAVLLAFIACENQPIQIQKEDLTAIERPVLKFSSIVVLGSIQDAGSPQIGCEKDCCRKLFDHPDNSRRITSLGLVDVPNGKSYLFEASPDIALQLQMLHRFNSGSTDVLVDGIFLSHAHIGHYTGLMFLGKEAIDAKAISVFAMPRMRSFLEENGPWNQLVERENIHLKSIEANRSISLSDQLKVIPFLVPHRDEFSETVGYKIIGPNKSALFIPDIDKWEKWERDIVVEIEKVDYAFLDATFYSGEEIDNRDISQIPHPFIIESLERFEGLKEKKKVIFIHFNHTNPIIDSSSEEAIYVREQGYKIASLGDVFAL